MSKLVLDIWEIENSKLSLVGGKGANLGELSKIQGIYTAEGFCITTKGYLKAIEKNESIQLLIDQLKKLSVEEIDQIRKISRKLREKIMDIEIPTDVVKAVSHRLSQFGENQTYAVRSSATAEDLPQASFAGQHETYLNIIGIEAILNHIKKCWASLYTERAVVYRMKNNLGHNQVSISIIIQKMVFPEISGIVFTADPITSNRKLLSIDASFGLGEALVSGLVTADCYKIREDKIVDKMIATKKLAIYGRKDGGTKKEAIRKDNQNVQALTDEQIIRLAQIGRRIEAYFGQPQDIEWCFVEDTFYIVQTRPITTLFPIPKADETEGNRVFVSVGHQQMMTEPIKPLGLSFYMLTTFAPMTKAGGWLFVDVTEKLASSHGREILLTTLGESDPLIKDALKRIVKRADFIPSLPNDEKEQILSKSNIPTVGSQVPLENNPSLVTGIIKKNQKSLEELQQNIQSKSGWQLFDFILADIQILKKMLFDPESMRVIMAAQEASSWVNEKMYNWLGEVNVADTLSQSVPHNITSKMGLELLDVADVIRPYPDVIAYLQRVKDDNFLDELDQFAGGEKTKDAIIAYLDKYGMRCAGEIDIAKSRWKEKPLTLIPILLNNIKNFGPNASERKFEQGKLVALEMENNILERLKQLPDGQKKVREAKQRIDLIRDFNGYREYPKYFMVSRYFIYKQALLKEAEDLVEKNIIYEKEDIYYLSFEELHDVVRTEKLVCDIISQRKNEYRLYEKLKPPRVITSHGEIIVGEYKRENLPSEALVGLPVSTGVIEGRARVILNMEDADLEDGDILVTTFTDPSWTPLFVSINGLVTEVGGLMTHGAVIAREYGLPAVVGVEHATKRIKDGQRIRLNGTEGYIEIL